jgi:hypothetical protein
MVPVVKGKFALTIPVSFDAKKRVAVIFSRPTLEASMFLHMPPDSEGFKLLLDFKFEPRVWKFLFVHFPGPGVFAPSDQAIGQSLSPRPTDAFPTATHPLPRTPANTKPFVLTTNPESLVKSLINQFTLLIPALLEPLLLDFSLFRQLNELSMRKGQNGDDGAMPQSLCHEAPEVHALSLIKTKCQKIGRWKDFS